MLERRERPGRQAVLCTGLAAVGCSLVAHDENHRLIFEHGHNRGIEADFYGRGFLAHLHPSRVMTLEALARDTSHIRVGYHGAILPSLERCMSKVKFDMGTATRPPDNGLIGPQRGEWTIIPPARKRTADGLTKGKPFSRLIWRRVRQSAPENGPRPRPPERRINFRAARSGVRSSLPAGRSR